MVVEDIHRGVASLGTPQDGAPYLLIIDDNLDDVFLTLRVLEKNKFHLPVQVARNGWEALELFSENETLPVAVLANYRLPGMSGAEVIDRLREREPTSELPALLLVSSDDEGERVCGINGNTRADGCVVKPIDFDQLVSTLGALEVVQLADT